MDVQEAMAEFCTLLNDVRAGNERYMMYREKRLHELGNFLTLQHGEAFVSIRDQ